MHYRFRRDVVTSHEASCNTQIRHSFWINKSLKLIWLFLVEWKKTHSNNNNRQILIRKWNCFFEKRLNSCWLNGNANERMYHFLHHLRRHCTYCLVNYAVSKVFIELHNLSVCYDLQISAAFATSSRGVIELLRRKPTSHNGFQTAATKHQVPERLVHRNEGKRWVNQEQRESSASKYHA